MIYALAVVIAGCAGFLVFIRLLERVSVYFPEKAETGATATLFGAGSEEIWLTTRDQVRLNAILAPPLAVGSERARNGASVPTVLYLHGNAGHLYDRADKVRILQELGAEVLTVDYRGYGKSEGKPSEQGLYWDAEAAYDWLINVKRVPAGRVVVYGESLGGAPAVHLAATRPVGGLICEGCFTSAADMARTLIPFVPFEILLSHKFPVLQEMRKVRAPVLLIHARDDEVVPFAQGRRLYEVAAKLNPATLIPLEGGHNNAYLADSARYRAALQSFFEDLP